MSNTKSSRFYWGDWINDSSLKLCSFAAKGLWSDILAYCGLSDNHGHLEVAGKPVSVSELAVLIGHPLEEIQPLLAELESRRVFSRDRRGCIYNRRMVRDEINRSKSIDNGKKGGNPSLRKQTTKSQGVNPQDNLAQVEPLPIPSFLPSSNTEPLIERPLSETNICPVAKESQLDVDWFSQFKNAYPSRSPESNAWAPARKSFDKQIKAGVDPPTIVAAAANFAQRMRLLRTEPKHIPMAATWLNQQRWTEDPEPPDPQIGKPNGHGRHRDGFAAIADEIGIFRESDWEEPEENPAMARDAGPRLLPKADRG